jgi:hypothetical protein
MASGEACVIALRKGSMDGSEILDSVSSKNSPSGTCLIVDSIALNKSCIECDNVCLLVPRPGNAPSGSPRQSPVSYSTAPGPETEVWIQESPLHL